MLCTSHISVKEVKVNYKTHAVVSTCRLTPAAAAHGRSSTRH